MSMDDIYDDEDQSYESDFFSEESDMDDEEALDSLATEFDDVDEDDVDDSELE